MHFRAHQAMRRHRDIYRLIKMGDRQPDGNIAREQRAALLDTVGEIHDAQIQVHRARRHQALAATHIQAVVAIAVGVQHHQQPRHVDGARERRADALGTIELAPQCTLGGGRRQAGQGEQTHLGSTRRGTQFNPGDRERNRLTRKISEFAIGIRVARLTRRLELDALRPPGLKRTGERLRLRLRAATATARQRQRHATGTLPSIAVSFGRATCCSSSWKRFYLKRRVPPTEPAALINLPRRTRP